MSELIRRIEDRDFKAVSALYNGRKTVKELKWLYTDPDDRRKYNAFVAENERHEVIGAIAYSLSTYIQGDRKIKGVIPMNWKILEDYKGMAGILLFKKILSFGDFTFVISGSETALNLYSLFKLNKALEIVQFYKILNLYALLKSYKRKNFIKTYGVIGYLLPSYYKNSNKKTLYQDIEFIQYDGKDYLEELNFDGAFKKEISKNYVDWLLSCPVVNSIAFQIKRGHKKYGICVLYIKTVNKVKRGRITYLPFLGNDKKLWNSVITKCIEFFKKEKCCFITGQSYHETVTTCYLDSGFIKIDKHHDPLFIKDSKSKLQSMSIENWHLQYAEGDKAYIEI